MDLFPTGGVIPILVLLPNLLIVFFPPKTLVNDSSTSSRLKIISIIERVGQIGCIIIPFFYQIHISTMTDKVVAGSMIGILAIYYAGWIRYLIKGRGEEWFYRPMVGIWLPMVIVPVVYFLFSSFLLKTILLLMATLIFAIGHITVSWFQYREINKMLAS